MCSVESRTPLIETPLDSGLLHQGSELDIAVFVLTLQSLSDNHISFNRGYCHRLNSFSIKQLWDGLESTSIGHNTVQFEVMSKRFQLMFQGRRNKQDI